MSVSAEHSSGKDWKARRENLAQIAKRLWTRSEKSRQFATNGLAVIGFISLVVSFFPFVSVWIGRPELVVRLMEDESGRSVVRGKNGDFGLQVGTVNTKYEVILQEVKVAFKANELDLHDNDIFTDMGLFADDRAWISWKGEQALQPKSYCLLVAPFTASDSFTNTTTIEVTVRATVPSSELSFPWIMFPPPVQKTVFQFVLHWQPEGMGTRAGFLIGPKEGLLVFGSAATNAISAWTKHGTAELRILERFRAAPTKDDEK